MLAHEPSATYVERKTRQTGGLASNISLVIRYNKIELQKELFKGFLLVAGAIAGGLQTFRLC